MSPAEILAEHALARRLGQPDLDRFGAEGVPPLALARSCFHDWAFVANDRVVFENRGRFEFARHRPERRAVDAYVVVLLDEAGDPADILAFNPDRVAIWLGRVALIGEEQISIPRFGEPLDVYPTILDWLRAMRRGVVILDNTRAAGLLDGVKLSVGTDAERRRLETALTRPAPPIVVRQSAFAEAAE